MDVTLFIAKILGILYTVIGIGILLNMKAYMRMFEDFIEHPAVIYLTGVGLLIGGVAIILNHNVWVLNWPVVITIMGFTATYKGIALIIFPNAMVKMIKKFITMRKSLMADIIFVILLGSFLIAKGFQLI